MSLSIHVTLDFGFDSSFVVSITKYTALAFKSISRKKLLLKFQTYPPPTPRAHEPCEHAQGYFTLDMSKVKLTIFQYEWIFFSDTISLRGTYLPQIWTVLFSYFSHLIFQVILIYLVHVSITSICIIFELED